jgi:hypothetical protein
MIGVVRTAMAAVSILVGGIGGLSVGCAKPEAANYQEAWDGQATEFEVPPARVVLVADAGAGSGGGLGGGGSAGDLTACTRSGQANCCYEDKPGAPTGRPRCSWRRLGPGETTTIVAAFKGNEKITLPVAVTLSGATPARFTTYDDCLKAPVGFVLSAAGMKEGPLVGDISHFTLKTDGTWAGGGGGGASGFVVGRDPGATRDGGPPAPTYSLHEGLCQPLQTAEVAASIHFFDQVSFTLGGVEYRAHFDQHPNGGVTGYYVLVGKDF